MKTHVSRWGNSLAVRIPKELAESAQLSDGDQLEITVPAKGGLLFSRRSSKVPTLEELVEAITPENKHPETDWGKPRGKEVW